MSLQLCKFAQRQYRDDFSGTKITPEITQKLIELADKPAAEFPGYADFCKIISIQNRDSAGSPIFTNILSQTINRQQALKLGAKIHTAYEARTEAELPVLVEWVTNITAPVAEFIHLILYSREQMEKENDPVEADWAIVSITAAMTIEPEPMKPITMMRNALGISEGGSGVPIDRNAYWASVKFWQENLAIRQ